MKERNLIDSTYTHDIHKFSVSKALAKNAQNQAKYRLEDLEAMSVPSRTLRVTAAAQWLSGHYSCKGSDYVGIH